MYAPEAFLRVISVLGMAGLAAWLLYLNRRSPLHLTFASFLLMRALLVGAPWFAENEDLLPVLADAVPLVQILVPFLVPFFLFNFQRCHCIAHVHGSRWERPLFMFYMVAPFIMAALYLGWPHLYAVDRIAALRGEVGAGYGPLFAANGLDLLAFALIGLLFEREVPQSQTPLHRYSYLSVSLGFALTAAFEGLARPLRDVVVGGRVAGVEGLGWPHLLALLWSLVAAGISIHVAFQFRRFLTGSPDAEIRSLRRPVFGSLAAATFCALAVPMFGLVSSLAVMRAYGVLSGVWSFAIPVLVTFAILRHHLFDIDLKFRLTIKRGALAALFVAVFFAASEGTQVFVEGRWGPAVGVLASSVLVLFLGPLQRRAERLAETAVPMANGSQAWGDEERRTFYREQVHIAWGDGGLNPKERALLAHLRQRLGLSLEEADRIESQALAEHWLKPAATSPHAG